MKKQKIKIKINGKIKTIFEKSTLFELINQLKIPLNKVAIELNKQIIDKKQIKKIKLKKHDVIEIVQFIGGG
jgi:thiamine biosynthesis protein ThiS